MNTLIPHQKKTTKPTQDLHDIQFMLCELQKFLHRGLSMRDYAGPACDMTFNGSWIVGAQLHGWLFWFGSQLLRRWPKLDKRYMGVSKNSGTPKSSILIGFSIINHPFWGTLIFGNTHIYWLVVSNMFFNVHPFFWGRWTHFDEHDIIQNGVVETTKSVILVSTWCKQKTISPVWMVE